MTWASTTRGELHILVDIASRDEFVIDSQKAFSSIVQPYQLMALIYFKDWCIR